MSKPLEELLTPRQWLARSLGWVMSCLGGWLLLISLLLISLQNIPSKHHTLIGGLFLSSAVIAHALLWWKAFAGIWLWPADSDEWLLEAATRVWVAVLALFQVVSLLLLLGVLGLAFGENEGSDLFKT